MNCQACKADIPQGSKFCPECGASIISFLACTHCGTQIPPNSSFCQDCGKPIKVESNNSDITNCNNTQADEFAYLLSEEKIRNTSSGSNRIPYGCVAVTFVDDVVKDIQDQVAVATDQTSALGDFLNRVIEFTKKMMGQREHEVKTYVITNYQDLPLISYSHSIPITGVLNASLRFNFWIEASINQPEEASRALGLFIHRVMGSRASITTRDFRLAAISAIQSLLANNNDIDVESESGRNELMRILRQTIGISGKCILVKGKAVERRFIDVSKVTGCVQCKDCAHEYKEKIKFCEYCGANMEQDDWVGAVKLLQTASRDAIILKLSFVNEEPDTVIPDNVISEVVIDTLSTQLMNLTTDKLKETATLEVLNKDLNDILLLKFKGVLSDFKVIDVKTAEHEWYFKTEALIAEELRKIDAHQRGLAIDERSLDYNEAAFALAMRSARQQEEQRWQQLELSRQSADRELAEYDLDTRTELKKEEIDHQADADRFDREKDKLKRERNFQRDVENEDRIDEKNKANHEMSLEESVAQHDIKLADMTGEAQSRSKRRDISDQVYEAEENLRLKVKEKEEIGRIDEDLQDRQHQRQVDKIRAMAELEANMAKQEYDFEVTKIEGMRGMDASQILAMQAAQLVKSGGTEAAEGIVASIAQSQADAAGIKIKEELYKEMLQNKNDATNIALNTQQSAMETIMKNNENLSKMAGSASSIALEGYKEAAKIAQSTNEKSMDSMSKVATAAAGRKPNKDESEYIETYNCIEPSCDYIFKGKVKKFCPKCGANQFE